MVCSQLLSHRHFASRIVVGVTKTKARHESIRRSVLHADVDDDVVEKKGGRFRLATLDEVLATTTADTTTACGSRPGRQYKDVVFCAPPSGFDDYAYASGIAEVATRLWSAATPRRHRGSFVFTSSGVVYGDDGSGGVVVEDGTTAAITIVNESSPTVVDVESGGGGGGGGSNNSNAKSSFTNSSNDGSKNPRALRMLRAENAALSMGGCALRLAGLYSLDRGAHNYWLEKFGGSSSSSSSSSTNNEIIPGAVPSRGDGIINLLHYEDAASAVISALVVGPNVNSGRVFLISDGHPLTRKQICTIARQHVRYDGFGMPLFIDDDDDDDDDVVVKTTDGGVGKGKVYDGRKSNDALQWKPKYPSFDEFMTSKTT